MLSAGLVDEVQTLLDAGYDPDSSAMSAIGYKQIASYLCGEIPLPEAVRQIKRKTRKYVRQQANWFQEADPNIQWFDVSNDVFPEIVKKIQQFLP
jgi:tRNA dimethylallyltransferase